MYWWGYEQILWPMVETASQQAAVSPNVLYFIKFAISNTPPQTNKWTQISNTCKQ